MPERTTKKRAARARRQGKAATTQAGEYVREEMHHIRRGKHGARSTKQAIAIGLSKARRSGVDLPPPRAGSASRRTRRGAQRDYRRGRAGSGAARSSRRSQSSLRALRREGRSAASRSAVASQARSTARRRGSQARRRSARAAARTRRR